MSLEAKIEALTEVMTRVAANQDQILKMAGAPASAKPDAAADEAPRSRRRAAAEPEAAEEAPRSRRRAAEAEPEAEKPAGRRARGADKEEAAADEKPAGRRARAADKEEKAAPTWKRPADGKAKLDDIRACFAEFLNTKDKKVEEDRRGHIEDILDFLNVEKTSDIDKRDFEEVLDWIEQFLDDKFKGFPEN